MVTPLSECPSIPSWTFIHGILLGQGSMVILAVLFLKYVVFEDPEVYKQQVIARDRAAFRAKRVKPAPTISTLLSTSTILTALSYDLPTHPPETPDWLNVLLAQMLTAYRTLILQSTAGAGGAKGLMEEILNRRGATEGEGEDGDEGLIGVDRIRVGEVELGEGFPVLSNARVRPSSDDGAVRIELDLDYTDHVSLSLSTSLLVNFPRPRFAILPISLSLTLTRFSGTLSLELPSLASSLAPPHFPHSHPTLHFSLHPDFTLNLSITSLLGSRAKLQDIPKVEQLILSRIRSFIQDRIVWPGRVEVSLPGVLAPKPPASSDGEQDLDGLSSDKEWEWIHESESIDSAPNADSDDEGTTTRDGKAEIDLDADGGPSVFLRPKIRRRPIGSGLSNGAGGGGISITTGASTGTDGAYELKGLSSVGLNANGIGGGGLSNGLRGGNFRIDPKVFEAPPSPTESLPGFYRSSRTKQREMDDFLDTQTGRKGGGGMR